MGIYHALELGSCSRIHQLAPAWWSGVECGELCHVVGAPLKGMDSVYGGGNGSIILDNVVCNGDEQDLFQCTHNDFFETNCDHTEDVAVVCNGGC